MGALSVVEEKVVAMIPKDSTSRAFIGCLVGTSPQKKLNSKSHFTETEIVFGLLSRPR